MKRNPWIGAAMAALLLLCAVGAALAQGPDPEQMAEKQISMMKDRLKLTADQEKKLKPILIDSMKQNMEIRQKYQVKRGEQPSEEARAAMQKAREATMKKMSDVLDKGQIEEYRKLMAERMGGFGGGRKKQ